MDGKISTVAGNGTGVFSGDGGPASSAPLSPDGVAVAGDGTLYTADHYQNRIRRVGVDGKISTVAGNGTSGFSGDGGPASSAQLYSPLGFPSGVAVAGDGTLYISDVGNNRIRKVTFATAASPAISSLSPAAATAGGPGLTLTVTGSGFVASSTVQWNGGLLATTYVNAAQLTAAVPTGLVASSGTASVAVTTPGSGTTGALIFTITPSPPRSQHHFALACFSDCWRIPVQPYCKRCRLHKHLQSPVEWRIGGVYLLHQRQSIAGLHKQ